MNFKKLTCLFLALVLVLACFSGCRSKKEQQQAAEENQPEVVEVLPPTGQQGLTVDEDPLEIDVPEDSELVGDDMS